MKSKKILAALLLWSCQIISSSAGCEVGTEYEGNCYLYVETKETWHDAQADCEARNGNLATINNADENAFIGKLSGWSWIGANDEQTEGVYKWIGNGADVTYSDWAPGQPSSGIQNCVTTNYGLAKLGLGKWDDDLCTQTRSYICQGRNLFPDYTPTGSFTLDGGFWGDWGPTESCRYPHFVTKMELNIQIGGDDTALNAIRLTCTDGHTILSSHQDWGTWRGVKACPSSSYIKGAQIRREAEQGKRKDDSAANGVRFECTDGTKLNPGDGYWGDWGPWMSCPEDSAVIGMKTQIQTFQGIGGEYGNGDDTALNDVTFYCAKILTASTAQASTSTKPATSPTPTPTVCPTCPPVTTPTPVTCPPVTTPTPVTCPPVTTPTPMTCPPVTPCPTITTTPCPTPTKITCPTTTCPTMTTTPCPILTKTTCSTTTCPTITTTTPCPIPTKTTCPTTTCPTITTTPCPIPTKTTCPTTTCPTITTTTPCPIPSKTTCPTTTCPTIMTTPCPTTTCPTITKTPCPIPTKMPCPTATCPTITTTPCPIPTKTPCPTTTCPPVTPSAIITATSPDSTNTTMTENCSDAGCRKYWSGLGVCLDPSTFNWSEASNTIDFSAGTKPDLCSRSCNCGCYKHTPCKSSACEDINGICLIPDLDEGTRLTVFIPEGFSKKFYCDKSINCSCYAREEIAPTTITGNNGGSCKTTRKCKKRKGKCFGKFQKVPEKAKFIKGMLCKRGCKCYKV